MEPTLAALLILLAVGFIWFGFYMGWDDFRAYILPFLLILGVLALVCTTGAYLVSVVATNSWTWWS